MAETMNTVPKYLTDSAKQAGPRPSSQAESIKLQPFEPSEAAERVAHELARYKRRSSRVQPTPERIRQERIYRARVREWVQLPENRCCRVYLLLLGRKVPATHCYHYQGRRGMLLLYEPYWIPVSWEGHHWINDHREEARRLGLLCPLGRYNSPVHVSAVNKVVEVD